MRLLIAGFTGIAVGTLLLACRKDPPALVPPKTGPSTVDIVFKATIGGLPVLPNDKVYYNAAGDSFTVTKFTYYISALQLKGDDGSVFTEPDSYHLVRHVEGAERFTVPSLPYGNYDRLSFSIGIDSVRNVSGAQSGDLDPAQGMFWDWNTGYIFFKLEGAYRDETMDARHDFAMHIGGFSGDGNCIRKCQLALPRRLTASPGSKARITVHADVGRVFSARSLIGINDYYNGLPAGNAINRAVADNYAEMFSVAEVADQL